MVSSRFYAEIKSPKQTNQMTPKVSHNTTTTKLEMAMHSLVKRAKPLPHKL